jgi:hypothetical protein
MLFTACSSTSHRRWPSGCCGCLAARRLVDGDFIRFGDLSVRLRGMTSGLEHLLPLMLVFFFSRRVPSRPAVAAAPPTPPCRTSPRPSVGGPPGGHRACREPAEGTAAAETMLRLSEGWPFLVAAGTLIFTLVLLAARLSNTSWPERRLDIDTRDMSRQLTRLVSPQRSGALVAAAFLAAFAGVAASSAPRPQPPSVEREMLFKFPPEIDGWVGSRVGLPQDDRSDTCGDRLPRDAVLPHGGKSFGGLLGCLLRRAESDRTGAFS